MVPTAKALATRQTAELAALEKRISLVSHSPKPHAMPEGRVSRAAAPAWTPSPSVAIVHAPAADLHLEISTRAGGDLWGLASIPAHTGVIQVLDEEMQQPEWMNGMHMPVDIIFVGANGTVHALFANVGPQSEPVGGIAKYLIYLPAGEAAADGITIGTKLNVKLLYSTARSQIPRVELPGGTPITLAGDGSVSSSSAQVGARITMYAAQDVKVNGWTAVARCAVVQATVVFARPANPYEGGELSVSPEWIESTDGEHVSLRGESFTLYGAGRTTFPGKGSDVALDSVHPLLSHTSQDVYLQRSTGSTPANHLSPDGGSAKYQGAECHNGGTLNVNPPTPSGGGQQVEAPLATSNAPGAYVAASTSPQGQSARVQDGDKWSGVIDDARGGHGQFILSFAAATTPNGSSFGQFQALFGGNLSNYGDITGLEQHGAALSFHLESRRQPSCVYLVSASIGQDSVMRGSYQGCFANTGTFSLQKR